MTDYETCSPKLDFFLSFADLNPVFPVGGGKNLEKIDGILETLELTLRNTGQAPVFLVIGAINKLQLGQTYSKTVNLISKKEQGVQAIIPPRRKPSRKIVNYQNSLYSQLKFYSLGLKIYLFYVNDKINSS